MRLCAPALYPEKEVNQTAAEKRSDAVKTRARAISRRQLILRSALALGGLAMAPMLPRTSVRAASGNANAEKHVQLSQRDMDALSEASVLYIATVRKNGAQSTPAPVWFTIAPDHSILIQTQPTTWKARRIRRGSPVIVWIGKPNGPAFVGRAEITGDPAVSRQIVDDYPKRYLMARLGLHRPTQEMFDKGRILAVAIAVVRDLPEGFASKPGTPAPGVDGLGRRSAGSGV